MMQNVLFQILMKISNHKKEEDVFVKKICKIIYYVCLILLCHSIFYLSAQAEEDLPISGNAVNTDAMNATSEGIVMQENTFPTFQVQTSTMYTYANMVTDILSLQTVYPNLITVEPLATTISGKIIPMITLGNPAAPHKIMIQASIHAREYGTTQMVMKMLSYCMDQYSKQQNADVFINTAFYIIPMANPDGVEIAQSICPTWKANALGIDLNHNFNAGWEIINTKGIIAPASENFKGYYPESEIEVQALTTLAQKHDFDCYISYHQQGNIIYYDDIGATPETSAKSANLAHIVHSINGYKMVSLKSSTKAGTTSFGGFSDWVQLVLQKPAITVECGTAYPPVGQSQVASMYERNKDTWFAVARSYY